MNNVLNIIFRGLLSGTPSNSIPGSTGGGLGFTKPNIKPLNGSEGIRRIGGTGRIRGTRSTGDTAGAADTGSIGDIRSIGSTGDTGNIGGIGSTRGIESTERIGGREPRSLGVVPWLINGSGSTGSTVGAVGTVGTGNTSNPTPRSISGDLVEDPFKFVNFDNWGPLGRSSGRTQRSIRSILRGDTYRKVNNSINLGDPRSVYGLDGFQQYRAGLDVRRNIRSLGGKGVVTTATGGNNYFDGGKFANVGGQLFQKPINKNTKSNTGNIVYGILNPVTELFFNPKLGSNEYGNNQLHFKQTQSNQQGSQSSAQSSSNSGNKVVRNTNAGGNPAQVPFGSLVDDLNLNPFSLISPYTSAGYSGARGLSGYSMNDNLGVEGEEVYDGVADAPTENNTYESPPRTGRTGKNELQERAKKKAKKEIEKRVKQYLMRYLVRVGKQLAMMLSQTLAKGIGGIIASGGWVALVIILIILAVLLIAFWLAETTQLNQTAASIERIELYLGDSNIPVLEKFSMVIGKPKEGDISFGNNVNGTVWSNAFILDGPNGEKVLEIKNIQGTFQFKRISDGILQNIKDVELIISFPISDFSISNFDLNMGQGIILSKSFNNVVIKCNISDNCNPYNQNTFNFDVKFERGLNLVAFNNKFMILYSVNKIVLQDNEVVPNLSRNGIRLCFGLIYTGNIGLLPCDLNTNIQRSSLDNIAEQGKQSNRPTNQSGNFQCPLNEVQMQSMVCTDGFNVKRGNTRHNGLDIAPRSSSGLTADMIYVQAPVTGTIIYTYSRNEIILKGGNLIIIEDEQTKYKYVLAHINTNLTKGVKVVRGQTVGTLFNPVFSNKGTDTNLTSPQWSTGVHLHFEVRKPDGTYIDPLPDFIINCGLSANFKCMRN